ncbi:MAG: glycosyltransferase family 2 protein [Bryobacteraceae bacterium]
MPAEPRSVLIIPALNEEQAIGRTLDAVPWELYRQVLVADNGSRDRTAEIAVAHGATVVSEPQRGYGAACLRALAAVKSGAEAVVFMDADSSDDPQEAFLLLAPILEGRAELVLGSRTLGKVEKGSVLPHQAFGNRLATALIRLIYGYRFSDLGPFRAVRTDCLMRLGMRDRNYGWTAEMQIKAVRQGLRIVEIPVTYRKRIGKSKISGRPWASVRAGFKIVWTVLRLAMSA